MLATLLIASVSLSRTTSNSAAGPQPVAQMSSYQQVLQEFHVANKAFEALDTSQQAELLQNSRIVQLISLLQWQLVHMLQMYLPYVIEIENDAEV